MHFTTAGGYGRKQGGPVARVPGTFAVMVLVGVLLAGGALVAGAATVGFPGPLVVDLDTTTVSLSNVAGFPGADRLVVAGTSDGFLDLTQFRPEVGKVGVLTRYFLDGVPVDMIPDPAPDGDSGLVVALADPDRLMFLSVGMTAPYFQEIQTVDLAEDPGRISPLALTAGRDPGLAVSLPGMDRVLILGKQGPSWSVLQDLPVGDHPQAVAAGDADGDGLDEVYVSQTGYLSEDVGILSQDSLGFFSQAGTLEPGMVPGPVSVFDIEGAGTPQVVLGAGRSPSVLVYGYQGAALVERDRIALTLPASSLRLAEMPGGSVGMAVANTDRGLVNFLEYAEGAWSLTGAYYPGCRPLACLPHDLSGDGRIDLICPGDAPGYTVMFGTGSSGFWGFPALVMAQEPRVAAVADIDGGGFLSAVVADRVTPVLNVFHHLSAGIGAAQVWRDTLAFLPGLIVPLADETAAGQMVVVADHQGGRIVALDLALPGQARLLGEAPVAGDPVDLKAGDFDGDGHDDLVYALPAAYRVDVLFGDGAGGFPAHSSILTAFAPEGVDYLDADGDGYREILVSDGFSLQLWHNSGGREFDSPVRVDAQGGSLLFAAGDVDGDLDRDLVVYSLQEQNLSMLENDGQGNLVPRIVDEGLDQPATELILNDVTSDGRADILLNQPASAAVGVVLVGQQWDYTAALSFPTGSDVSLIRWGDFNQDGAGDLLALDKGLQLGLIMLNGSFSLVGVEPQALAITCTGRGPRITVSPDRPGPWLLEQERGGRWQALAGPGWTASGTITLDGGVWLLDPGPGFSGMGASGAPARLRLTVGSPPQTESLVRQWNDPCAKEEPPSPVVRMSWDTRPWPNPFNPILSCRVNLTRASRLAAGVYDVRGRLIHSLFRGTAQAGGLTLMWDGSGPDGPAASGVYFLHLDTGSDQLAAKVILAR